MMRWTGITARCTAASVFLLGAWASSPCASAQAPPAAVAQVRVVIHDYAFHPATLRIAPGTTVTWVNGDDDVHTVMSSDDGHMFSSPPLNTGQSFSHTFTSTGIDAYVCSVHPFMTGKIVVNPVP